MNDDNFSLAFLFAMKWEGGSKYTCDPCDPGGETKYGISKRSYPDIDIKSLTEEEARKIYQQDYWDKMGCPMMDKPLAIVAFDTAVNCGVGRTKKWMEILNVAKDDARRNAQALLQRRLVHYKTIVEKNPTLGKFSKGWNNRVNDLSKYIDIV